jgi:hypothetical protein
LDYFPTVTVVQRNGIDYNSVFYRCSEEDSDGNTYPTPRGSGKIDAKIVTEMAIRGID